jgi:hypothetical protein
MLLGMRALFTLVAMVYASIVYSGCYGRRPDGVQWLLWETGA